MDRIDQQPQQPSPEPIRITDDAPARTIAEEIRNARAALVTTGEWDRNNPTDARDASVLLHFRLQRLLAALDAEHVNAVARTAVSA